MANRMMVFYAFRPIITSIIMVIGICAITFSAKADSYAGWLTQIGVSDTIMSAAKWGRGSTIGFADTGINPEHSLFNQNQVYRSLSGCAAVTFNCSNGFMDDDGHGTAVAGIAAGNAKFNYSSTYAGYNVNSQSYISVAPNANIIAQKVLDNTGSGYTVDVANGIVKATNSGASIINVSISYANTRDIVNAINYATAKGVIIVWAGGNGGNTLLSGANTNGLTSVALKRIIFAGSVDYTNTISSSSNLPGSGKLNTSDGQQESYRNRWLMAPGEGLIAPYIQTGSDGYAYWTGTSMSTPIISGAIALLQSAWPILDTNNTAADLLIDTATDLGEPGVDPIYGAGLINLTKAFQPVGALQVKKKNNQMIDVSKLKKSMITGGALGKLSKLKSKLKNYTAFDSYDRNFSVDLSRILSSKKGRFILNSLPENENIGPISVKFNGQPEFSYWVQEQALTSESLSPFDTSDPTLRKQNAFASFRFDGGIFFAGGVGFKPFYGHYQALLEDDSLARLSLGWGESVISHISSGGLQFSYGMQVLEHDRVALSFSSSPLSNPIEPSMQSDADLIMMGWAHEFSDTLTGAFTFSYLNERTGFLGSVTSADSGFSMNQNGKTQSYELAIRYQFNPQNQLGFQSTIAYTDSMDGNDLLAGTTLIKSQSMAISWIVKNVLAKQDQINITVKQPLRVVNGDMQLLTANVDSLGRPVYKIESCAINPDGRETEFTMTNSLQL